MSASATDTRPHPGPESPRRRVAPAVGLFFLAPLVSEFLLGNLPISLLPALIVLAPLYGGGALLIREVVRHTRRGWASLGVLALAYGVFEEAFTTFSLFNPDYLKLHAHLLEPAFVAPLGIGGWWTAFVLSLHTVWSIMVSIALAEALVPDRETTPWLGRAGIIVTALFFAMGATVTLLLTLKQDPFLPSFRQLGTSAVIVVGLTVLAFRLPRGAREVRPGPAPNPWLAGVLAFTAGSVFFLVPATWGWGAVAAYLGLYAVVIALVRRWSSAKGWDGRHRLALAGGAALVYAWHAFPQPPVMGDPKVDLVGNAVFAAGAVALVVVAARRSRTAGPESF